MLSDRLRHCRETQGYTQEDFADLLGEAVIQVWRWENGRSDPKSQTLRKIAQVLNVSTDYLVGLTDDPSQDIREGDLTPKERGIIVALRHGRILEAVRMITQE